jgi:choline dehydrogenase
VLECDVAVVGGGSAGCAVAGRLAAESDLEVVLIEAGPDYGAFADRGWPPDLLDGGALATSHGWGYVSEIVADRSPIDFARAKVIGGCSSHNGCIAAVGCPEDYDRWATLAGDERWSAAALRPVFERVLERLHARKYDAEEIGPFHRAVLAAAAALGIPRADDLDDLDGGVGFGTEPVNVDGGVRVNTAFAYLDPVRDRPHLRIVDDAVVDRLGFASRGVRLTAMRHGEVVGVQAQQVVLSAGAYGTPAILQRSGVGDPERLRRAGIEPVHALPAVGRNLHDHPLIEVEFAGSDALRAQLREAAATSFVPEEQTLWKLRTDLAEGPYDVHVVPVASLEHSLFAGRVLIAAAALEPRSRGSLHVRSADPAEPPLIDHGYLTDPGAHDLAVLERGVEALRGLAASEPLRSLVGPETIPGRSAALDEAIRRHHGHYFHPVGTCAMGTAGDGDAVCDGAGRVLGLERVLVADCSLMPVVPRANTNVPAVVVGEMIAGELLAATL